MKKSRDKSHDYINFVKKQNRETGFSNRLPLANS